MSTNGASFKNRRKIQEEDEEEAAVEASSILSASSSDKYLIKASKPGLGKKINARKMFAMLGGADDFG